MNVGIQKLQNELKKYIICEKHYNQIVAKDNYLNYLKSGLSDYPRKRSRNFKNLSDNNNPILNEDQVESKVDIGIQVDIDNNYNLTNYKILELERECESLKKQVADLNIQLKELNSYLNQLTNRKNKLEIENINLKKQWDERYNTHQKRVTEITKIALLERKPLYNDIIYLINNYNRFSLKNLLTYNPSDWLKDRNSVIVKFIETLTDNDDEQINQNKIFKRTVAVDTIYKSRHSKYVSEINLAASAIKYSIARSKLIIDIDSHITSGGVTSFIALNFDSNDNSQSEINPWLRNSLSENDITQLFYLSDDMKKKLENKLYYFINEIINKLNIEKYQEVNEINQLIEKQNNLSNKLKKCLPYELTNSSIKQQESKISAIQKTVTSQNIKIPDLYVPDPIPVNPNSLANVQKVLEHIEIISGIKSGKCKWLPVVCDGVPYNQALKLKKNFPWLILLPGALHEEMNMLKAFVELNCHNNPTPNGYLEWAKNQTNETYKLKFEQIFTYLQAIVDFRTGVRTNQPLLRNAARCQFAPIWSARRHPIYRLIEVSYEESLLYLKPHVRDVIENVSVVSHSGLHNQHQGFDTVMEEINKTLKSLIPSVPSQRHWEIAARNFTNFTKVI
ncbi:hypothetical protein F8M41_018497 [Gigaspora margarita]|uniref:Uncharacterized protein n=1 Tax=Gigaspora margarita TaxID=4874 RepID=A0A8H4B2I7_GIGMA|nr:hypothetical protein F8M41_018497 [Gigaspora margarita]